ncbi:MAG TPA: hypothetical protein V6D07_09730 [Trichocoleus sp.]
MPQEISLSPFCPCCEWDEPTYDLYYEIWMCPKCDWAWEEDDPDNDKSEDMGPEGLDLD